MSEKVLAFRIRFYGWCYQRMSWYLTPNEISAFQLQANVFWMTHYFFPDHEVTKKCLVETPTHYMEVLVRVVAKTNPGRWIMQLASYPKQFFFITSKWKDILPKIYLNFYLIWTISPRHLWNETFETKRIFKTKHH